MHHKKCRFIYFSILVTNIVLKIKCFELSDYTYFNFI